MNRIIYNLSIFLLIIIACSSCFKPVEIELPPHTPKLVINSLLSPGLKTSAFVGISGTITADDRGYDSLLKVAQVNLIDEQGQKHSFSPFDTIVFDTLSTFINNTDTFYYVNQQFLKGFFPDDSILIHSGETYTFEVVHPEYGMATASTRIPNLIPLTSVDITPNAAVDLEGYSYSGINIEFEDPPGEANYYSVEAYYRIISPDGDTFYNNIYLYDLAAIQNSTFEETRAFSDRTFDGQKTRFTLYSDNFTPNHSEFKVFVRFNSVTESYYRYVISYDKFLFNQDINVGLFSSEPITVFSHVEGGYGAMMGINFGEYIEAE